MAFLRRSGNILTQATTRKFVSDFCSINSVSRSVRRMSNAPNSKLFIGGVLHSTDEQSLRQVFGKYGDVVDARIIVERDSGRSRGFGFITFSSVEEALRAIEALDGKDLHGRRVRVNFVGERPPGFRDGGYGGGAYGGNVVGGYGNRSSGYDNSFASEEGYGGNSGYSGGSNDIGNYGAYGGCAGYKRTSDEFDSSIDNNTSGEFANSDNSASVGDFRGGDGGGGDF